ncbi:hypothetical protein EST38_g7053 [Candolleomyces aberdarensis]|uniref:F-box domain-containing protein n=1 Tax=Candolleomyces aberdarensis TaxID=2316362 RepID=A0A4Q2DG45_9AGAR|nr:hypothetical protein EST38_g7053 [Candolleomyces aberdarensis]
MAISQCVPLHQEQSAADLHRSSNILGNRALNCENDAQTSLDRDQAKKSQESIGVSTNPKLGFQNPPLSTNQKDIDYAHASTTFIIPDATGGMDSSPGWFMNRDWFKNVCNYLETRDLMNLTPVSRLSRKVMLSEELEGIWRALRKRRGIPPPRTDISEYRWASLLYGSECEACWRRSAKLIDWYALRRTCFKCRQTMVHHQTNRESSNLDLLQYVQPTQRLANSITPQGNDVRLYYWDVDVDAIVELWQEHQDAIKRREPYSLLKDAEWKQERKAAINYNNQVSGQKPALNFFSPSFAILTYLSTKMARIYYDWSNRNGGMRRVIYQYLIDERIDILKKLYHKHLAHTMKPSDRVLYPNFGFFQQMPGLVSNLVESEDDVPVTEKYFRPLIAKFKEVITRTLREFERRLLTAIPLDDQTGCKIDPLQLARFVFQCERSGSADHAGGCVDSEILIGWPMIVGHCCGLDSFKVEVPPHGSHVYVPRQGKIVLNEDASYIASFLISVAGLDFRTTTIEEMDKLDLYFIFDSGKAITGRHVFSWRNAVYIYIFSSTRPCANL